MQARPVLQCCLSQAWGGLEMVALETAQRLAANGFQVSTVCLTDTPLARELKAAGLEVVETERRHKYFAFKAIRDIRTELKRRDYGSVLVHQLNDLWQLVPALTGFKKIRLIGVAHTFVGIRKKDFLHSWIYGRVNALVALTSLHRKNLTDHLPVPEARVAVLPNSIDSEKFQPARRSASFRKSYEPTALLIGVVSRLDENKGLRETLTSAALLRDQGVDFKLTIVGKETAGELGVHAALEQEIDRLDLKKHVYLAGHHSDIQNVMASFDVLLMPSPAETFGRVLIEAMASGVPIVASGGGGVPDIVQDGVNGLLVKPLDVPAMTEALKRYAQSPDLRRRMAERGLQEAKSIYETRVVERRLYDLLGLP
ncbi:MAG: glycosyltransferase family 4 protein [Bdellovibrionales bacterium]|nr:glycosyltransferase family 4 protein [Bdellovibrionales bacterium]